MNASKEKGPLAGEPNIRTEAPQIYSNGASQSMLVRRDRQADFNSNESLPIHAVEAERSVLGCILQNSEKLKEARAARITRQSFYETRHQDIYSVMLKLEDDGQGFDALTLQLRLKEFGLLEEIGGAEYLATLEGSTPCAENLPYYLPLLKDAQNRRTLQEIAARLGASAANMAIDSAELAADAERAFRSARGIGTKVQLPEAGLLGDLVRSSPGNDPNELLRHRFLCRGGGLLLVGPTGIGKSSFAMQCAILWALVRDCFGIAPARPLKSLFIQAENDDCDIAEMRDGVIAGLNFSAEDAEFAKNSILVCREDSKTSTRFFAETIAPLLKLHRPDILWIDPALAYIGGESSSQTDVGAFLRNGLNPLVHEFDCAVVVVHHANKPPSGQEKPSWRAGDFAYLGGGSAEWANWARAVLALRAIGSHDIFQLLAAKRGSRLGWSDPDGAKSYAKHIGHAREPGVICWRTVDPSEVDTGGRPKANHADEMLALLPPEGFASMDWQKQAKAECGISESTFFRERRSLEKAGRILKSKISSKWQPIKKA